MAKRMSHKAGAGDPAILLGLTDPAGDRLLTDREDLSFADIIRMDVPLESVMELLRDRRYPEPYLCLGCPLDPTTLHRVANP